jgi:UDP-glucose 4-epimerase
VPWSIEHPLECERINVLGTLQVLEAVRRENQRRRGQPPVRRVVLAASCAAYGDLEPEKPKQETDPVAPLSPYSAAKLACEHLAAIYSQTYGVPTVALRYFNVYGPRQDPASQYAAVVPRFINAALAGQRPTVFGDGLQSRDFVYVDNVIDANLLACQAAADRVAGLVINIGCGQGLSLLDLISTLSELTGRPITPDHQPARSGEVRHSRSDIRRAGELLGYRPRYLLRDGLQKTLAWYRDAKGRTE